MSNYTPGFEKWWTHYPKYKRKGKGAAFKSWQKHNLEDKAPDLIEVLDAQHAHDDHFKKYTPMPATYLNQARYDDDVPRPRRASAPMHNEPEVETEKDGYVRSVNRVAIPWLMRRGGIPPERVDAFRGLIRSLAADARDLHERGELTDEYAKTIREELDDFANRTPEVATDESPF
jgi:hypothetical protein